MSEDELGENVPPEGDWNSDGTSLDCVKAIQLIQVKSFRLKPCLKTNSFDSLGLHINAQMNLL